jgi:hypothetical protein
VIPPPEMLWSIVWRRLLLGLSIACLAGGVAAPLYVAYCIGYEAGDRDARHWTRAAAQHNWCAEDAERARHEAFLYHQCDLRVEFLQHLYESRDAALHPDAGARRR